MTDIKTDLGRDALEHFGVLGMKWGHRKNPEKGAEQIARDWGMTKSDLETRATAEVNAAVKSGFDDVHSALKFKDPKMEQMYYESPMYHEDVLSAAQNYLDVFSHEQNQKNPKSQDWTLFVRSITPNGRAQMVFVPHNVAHSETNDGTQSEIIFGEFEFVADQDGRITGVNMGVMSHSAAEDFLAHYGVLGMRWGYRKDELAIAKADAKFERKAVTKGLSRRKYVRAVNRAIKGFNKDIHDINKSPTFRNKDLTNKNDPVTRQYFELVQKTFEDHLAAASRKLPTNYSGTRQFRLNPSFDNRWPTVSVVDISASPADVDAQHSSVSDSNDTAPPAPMPLKAIFDQLGKVVRIEELVEEPIVMHSEELGEEFLEHFGILGMRWGYRKADNILAPKPQTQETKKLGPIQKHELNQLSNDEVKQVIERINLEKQLREAMTEPAKPKGQSWIQQNAGPLATKAAMTAATTATTMAIKWYFDSKKSGKGGGGGKKKKKKANNNTPNPQSIIEDVVGVVI